MNAESGGQLLSSAPSPSDKLRAAFRQHGASTGREWTVTVRRRLATKDADAAEETPSVRVDLTGADADVLADVLQQAAELAAGPGRRGANWAWIGSAEVAKMVGVEPTTIRAWVAGRRPSRHPFPRPGVKIPGRNLWRRRAVEKWMNERDAHGGPDAKHGDPKEP